MKSGFAHFDDSHRENFCAAVLLLTMEVDDHVRRVVADAVCSGIGVTEPVVLVALGREARLVTSTDDEEYARVDIWLLFRAESGHHFYAFVEVKTHDRWDARAVAAQVMDQATRRGLARSRHPIRGSMLLAPGRLCDRVRAARSVPTLAWSALLAGIRRNAPSNSITTHALKHLEDHVDRPVGNEQCTMAAFESATTTVACLRAFLLGCVADLGGSDTNRLNTTTGDGEPLRWNGWAWHGFSVSFKLDGAKHRVGVYKYVEAPPGDEEALSTPWLEVYADGAQEPIAYLPFNPTTLAPSELEPLRIAFRDEWNARRASTRNAAV